MFFELAHFHIKHSIPDGIEVYLNLFVLFLSFATFFTQWFQGFSGTSFEINVAN